MSRLVVVTALGKDRSGLVAELTEVFARNNINIDDIEESVIHGLFSMFMLVDVSNSIQSLGEIKKELAVVGKKFNLEIGVFPYEEYIKDGRYEEEKDLYVITVIGADRPGVAARVSKSLYEIGVNVERMKMVARGDLVAMELLIDGRNNTSLSMLREEMRSASKDLGMDIIVQPENIFRWRKRLVVFDMDGTLVDAEIINELAKVAGVGKTVSELTRRGMEGKIDFESSLRERVRKLKGLPISVLGNIKNSIKLTFGSEELILILKNMGYKIALISGGFTYFTDALKERLGFDYTFANELEIKNGALTGEILGEIIGPERKAKILDDLAKQEGISKEEIVAIGDGANDRIMIENAGLGIAFNAKDVLDRVADGSITKNNLKGLIYCLGITEKDIK